MDKAFPAVALCLVMVSFSLVCGCLEDSETTDDTPDMAIEHWNLDIDNGTGYGTTVMTKHEDGAISVNANWVIVWGFDLVYLNFTDGTLSLNGIQSLMIADGTAFYTGAPGGFTSSSFHLASEGVVSDGAGYDDYVITFSNDYWPTQISGHVAITRTSGSGVTP